MRPVKPKLNKEQRQERARQAVKTRWENARKKKEESIASATATLEVPLKETAPAVVDDPEPPTPLPTPVAAPIAHQKRKKPRMVKEFGAAHSYAQKRLDEALREHALAMSKIPVLREEIKYLSGVIKSLGQVPNLDGLQQDLIAPTPGINYPPPSGFDPMMQEGQSLPAVPIARGGGLGVIGEVQPSDEDQFLKGDAITGGGGWV